MKFIPSVLPGVLIIEPQFLKDERGFFARTFCQKEFKDQGLDPSFDQCSISYNLKKGTLRGLHFQIPPYEEIKLVRCTKGCIFDVVVDITPLSPSFGTWISVELSATNRKMLYIPKGYAHGFQTLDDESEVFYQISGTYEPQSARGIRWDDPSLAISWPLVVTSICKRDQEFPLMSSILK